LLRDDECWIITTAGATRCFAPLLAGGPVPVTVVDGQDEGRRAAVLALLDEWQDLRERAGNLSRMNCPRSFLCRLEAEVQGNAIQPFVLLQRRAGSLAVLMVGEVGLEPRPIKVGPLQVRGPRLNTLRIGDAGVVHDDRHPVIEEALAQLAALLDSGAVDVVEMLALTRGTTVHEHLCAREAPSRYRYRYPQVRWQTRLLDPQTGQRLQHHSAKTRQGFRWRSNKLDKAFGGDVRVDVVTDGSQVDGYMDEASAITAQSYQAALGIGLRADDAAMRGYLHQMAGRGELRSFVLRAQGRAIAYVQGDLQGGLKGGDYHVWSTSYLGEFRQLSPGIVLIHRALERLASDGVHRVHWGYGDAVYKREFGSDLLDLDGWHFCAPRARPRLALALQAAAAAAEARLRGLAGSGVVERLRRAWRRRLQRPVQ
jgi:hypothetical protein